MHNKLLREHTQPGNKWQLYESKSPSLALLYEATFGEWSQLEMVVKNQWGVAGARKEATIKAYVAYFSVVALQSQQLTRIQHERAHNGSAGELLWSKDASP